MMSKRIAKEKNLTQGRGRGRDLSAQLSWQLVALYTRYDIHEM